MYSHYENTLSANALHSSNRHSSLGLGGCTVFALVYGNESLTGRPDEMDFPSVDTSDCVVTVELRECGLIIDKDLGSAE